MNFSVVTHLILFGLRSFDAISPILCFILFHKSMAFIVTEYLRKISVQYGVYCSLNITTEPKTVFLKRWKVCYSVLY